MRLRNVLAIAGKEWRHLRRDPRSLALLFILPAMMLFLNGYAIQLDILEAPIGLLQESPDGESNELASHIEASRVFQVVRHFQDRAALQRSISRHEVWAAFVIPHDYAHDLAHNQARVQLVLDGTDANTARLLRNYALQLVGDVAQQRSGGAGAVDLQYRTWFNETNESRYAIVPGVIVQMLAVVGALMTALTIAREMESGNLVMLRTTPLTGAEFLVGKLVPYLIIGMIVALSAVACGVFVFGVPLRGSLATLTLVSALFLLVVTAQGALLSLVAGNQLLASQLVQVSTFLPSFLLSGMIYAIANMPVALQLITLLVPARFYVTMTKALFLKGAPLSLLWPQIGALLIALAVLGALLARQARRLGLGR
jgi:ABC-2 type transport system permease protein